MHPTFASLGLPERMVNNLAQRGITEPFPIQTATIPDVLAGRDVCGRAPTGSGKTLAFGLALVVESTKAQPRRPTGLVLVPTRELASQVAKELELLRADRRPSIATFYGGVGYGTQVAQLRRGVDIAVACPGRLADLVQQGHLHLGDVGVVVIDEADRMADMGFLPEVRRLLDQVRPDRQTLLFSATLDGAVDVLVRSYQRDPVRCDVAPPERHDDRTVRHFVETVREKRVDLTRDLVVEHGSTIVFCRTKRGADRVAKQLAKVGVSAVAIHGDRSQGQRDRALASFQAGKVQSLVATDVAASGSHLDDVG